MSDTGVGLGRLLLALDTTLVNLVEAPRGLDLPVASAALLDADDVRLGLAAAAGAADVFFLLGISPATVKYHLAHIFLKLGVRNRVEAAVLARRLSEKHSI